MTNKYLKPMLDTGSPRVFNCNEMTQKALALDPNAAVFFHCRKLNDIVLIKDTVPQTERKASDPSVGTKLYFPFNDKNIYEGGRTIFLRNQQVDKAIMEYCGESSIKPEDLEADKRILALLDRLPSLDPFLLKDVFLRNNMNVNPAYFEVDEEAWREIEVFMLLRFEPLVQAAFPEALSSDEKARQLIDKIWEARDAVALKPLIDAFRLPPIEALDIFSAWRGIVYYSYQYQREQPQLLELVKWLKENEAPVAGITAAEMKEMLAAMAQVKDQLRKEWQTIEDIVRAYQDSYDKMFKYKTSTNEFLSFLRNSNKIYWDIGNSIGKAYHGIYCWDVMSSRFKGRKLPWAQTQEIVKLLAVVFQPEKKTATSMAW